MYLSRILTTIALTCPLVSQAGPRDGGGATGAVCFQDAYTISAGDIVKAIHKANNSENRTAPVIIPSSYIPSIESVNVLDLIEATSLKDAKRKSPELIMIKPGESELDFVDRIISRFEVVYPGLYRGLKLAKERLSLDNISEDKNGIMPKDDIYSVSLIDIENCVYSTIAFQEGQRLYDNRLHIDGRIFNLPNTIFSRMNQATVFLHEVVYKFLRDTYDVETSRTARLFVTAFLKKNLNHLEIEKLFSLANLPLREISFLSHTLDDIPPQLEPHRYPVFSYDLLDYRRPTYINLIDQSHGLNKTVSDFSKNVKDSFSAYIRDNNIDFKKEYLEILQKLAKEKKIKYTSNQSEIEFKAITEISDKYSQTIKELVTNIYTQNWRDLFYNFPGLTNEARVKLVNILDISISKLVLDILKINLQFGEFEFIVRAGDVLVQINDFNKGKSQFMVPVVE